MSKVVQARVVGKAAFGVAAKRPDAVIRDKVRGCWMGKGIGGTAGMPFEGHPFALHLSRLEPLTSQLPNDDLEMQLLWLLPAEEQGLKVRAAHLAKIRVNYTAYPDEYGVALWNLERGLKPPVTGLHNNLFGSGMGSAIRSEIWACLFPGRPALAAAFAREDAIVDHYGDGVWGEMLLAAAESAAFTVRTPEEALRQGLAHIPRDCQVAKAVSFAMGLKRERATPLELRERIMRKFGSHDFTNVAMNLAFITMALVRGNSDFAKTIVLAVNCGMDTDCTAATCGAFLGILNGYEKLPAKYKNAMGQELVVSDCLKHLPLPATVDEATERVMALSAQMRTDLERTPVLVMTPDVKEDPVRDDYQWLVFRDPVEAGYAKEPAAIGEAEVNPKRFRRHLLRANGIHLDVASRVQKDGDTLYLLSWITVPRKVEGQLMICSDTGITAWLDGRQVLNYHGRLKRIPSFHRVEGGFALPVSFKPGTPVLLKLRLLGCQKSTGVTVALGEMSGRFVDARFSARGSTSR